MASIRISSPLAVFGAALLLQCAFHGTEARADDFYNRKTITLIPGFSAGGGYDAYDRLLATKLSEHIPGRPTVVVQNMPGAGSLTAVRALQSTLPQDGTAAVTFNPGLITDSIVEPEKVGLDFRQFAWVGIFTPDFRVCYGYGDKAPAAWSDLLRRDQFVLGTTAKGDGAYINAAMMRDVLGAPIKIVLGFPGSAEQRIAIEQGELDGDCGTFSSIPSNWLREGKVHAFVRFTRERRPEMPEGAAFIEDLAKTDAQRALLNFFDGENEIGRVLIMSNKVPADRLALMRKAFDETLRDPAVAAEAARENLPLNPVSGDEAAQIVARMASAPSEIVSKARKIFE